MTKPCEKALLDDVNDEVRPQVQEALAVGSAEEAKQIFRIKLAAYAEAEFSRPGEDIVRTHEFGGHLRPLFALYRANRDPAILERCMALFRMRRRWVVDHLYHGYCDCHEVHHEPETFLFFQIPLLNATGDREVLRAIEDVAEHAGNWVDGVPDWYDWQTHGFRSTFLGTREVRAYCPHDYQEANHFRIISIALAAYRHGAGQRYLDLAVDYAQRWLKHIERCTEAREPITTQIIPEGAVAQEIEYGGGRPKDKDLPPGVYPVFYNRVAPNTANDLIQGLQDVYRLTGDNRFLDAAGIVLAQFRNHRDTETGRWATRFKDNRWITGEDYNLDDGPLNSANSGLVSAAFRQLALRPDAGLRRDLIGWAEAVLGGQNVYDMSMPLLLSGASVLTGKEEFRAEAYRRLCAGMAATYPEKKFWCCNGGTRVGYGSRIATFFLLDQGFCPGELYGSWPLAWPDSKERIADKTSRVVQ